MSERAEGPEKTVGEILAAARSQQNKSIAEIERATKIRACFLQAVEDNNYTEISGDIYARGFIKAYAQYLGLDPEPLIKQYIEEYNHPLKFDSNIRPQQEEYERREGWTRRFTATLAIIGVLFLLFYWGSTASKKAAEEEKSAADVKAPASQQKSTRSPKKNAPLKPTPKPKPTGVNLTLKATTDEGCWLLVTVDGKKTFEGILQKNQSQEIKGKAEVKLSIGNAGGIEIKQDGENVGKIGDRGAVVERTFKLGAD